MVREILHPYSNISLRTDVIEYTPYGVLTPICSVNSYNEGLSTSEILLAEAIIHYYLMMIKGNFIKI